MDPVLLDLNDSVSGGGGEQPTQRLVIKTEDGRNECQPVEEAQVPTDDQNHLGTTPITQQNIQQCSVTKELIMTSQ